MGRHVLAFVIGGVLLAGTVFLIQDASRTEALSVLLKGWSVVLCIDFLIMASFCDAEKEETAGSCKKAAFD